ncbi:MAG: ABC transporter ATP-binding protein, partial [Sedimentisphaerales bacterium]|nr:ABC transporter ATP-binding protein [Sedimentisphaerales bacterium]
MTKNNTILSAKNIHKHYRIGRSRQRVLNGVNLDIPAGEFVAITGASGSGKSTLLHILGLLDTPDEGEVRFQDQQLLLLSASQQDRIRRKKIGFVFQFYHLLPELTLEENVLLPLMVDSSLLAWPARR